MQEVERVLEVASYSTTCWTPPYVSHFVDDKTLTRNIWELENVRTEIIQGVLTQGVHEAKLCLMARTDVTGVSDKSFSLCKGSLIILGYAIGAVTRLRSGRSWVLLLVGTITFLCTLHTGSGAQAVSGSTRTEDKETDYRPPFNIEIKNEWSYIFIPSWRLHDVLRDNFTFYCSQHAKFF